MSARCLTEYAVEGHPQPRGYKGTVEQKLAGGRISLYHIGRAGKGVFLSLENARLGAVSGVQ